jgi:spermidine/putrescine transport system substrate-binding protein
MMNNHRYRFPRRLKRRQFLQLAGLATLSTKVLSGCGWKLGEVRAQGSTQRSSKELFIYTWSSYTDQDLLDRFHQRNRL